MKKKENFFFQFVKRRERGHVAQIMNKLYFVFFSPIIFLCLSSRYLSTIVHLSRVRFINVIYGIHFVRLKHLDEKE